MTNKKVQIEIFIDDAGQVGYRSSSSNQITNLGLLEIAKAIIMNAVGAKPEEPSMIVVPHNGDGRI